MQPEPVCPCIAVWFRAATNVTHWGEAALILNTAHLSHILFSMLLIINSHDVFTELCSIFINIRINEIMYMLDVSLFFYHGICKKPTNFGEPHEKEKC